MVDHQFLSLRQLASVDYESFDHQRGVERQYCFMRWLLHYMWCLFLIMCGAYIIICGAYVIIFGAYAIISGGHFIIIIRCLSHYMQNLQQYIWCISHYIR